jgi:uncharacterized protein (DUF1778 family)
MPKNSRSLSVKELPPELLTRVNAKAALEGIDQPTFVIEALEEATKDLIETHERVKREREARKKRSK